MSRIYLEINLSDDLTGLLRELFGPPDLGGPQDPIDPGSPLASALDEVEAAGGIIGEDDLPPGLSDEQCDILFPAHVVSAGANCIGPPRPAGTACEEEMQTARAVLVGAYPVLIQHLATLGLQLQQIDHAALLDPVTLTASEGSPCAAA